MSETTELGMGAEEKFFGKQTVIDTDTPPPAVEVIEDTAPPPPSSAAATTSDDDDEELERHSEKVQKRIKKLTWQREEEKRQREAAEQVREEAVRVAQALLQRNQQYEQTINQGEAFLIQQIKDKATLAMEKARDQYRRVYEEGDTDAIIKAQEEMLAARSQWESATEYENEYRARGQQRMWQPQPPPPPPSPPVLKPTERAAQWAKDNPWFSSKNHPDMTALAFGVHERLVREEGVAPDTDEYYREIDRSMRQRFPEYFAERERNAPRSPSSVVAPASRNNGGAPRQVRLSQHQITLAKRLGLTLEQYAQQVLKEMSND